MSTRRKREEIFIKVMEKAGDKPYKSITRKVISASRDERAATPHAAKTFLKAMSGLFNWAMEAEYVEINPCAGVKPPRAKNTGGIAAWTEEDVAKY